MLDERILFKLELAKQLLNCLSPEEVKQAFQTELESNLSPKISVIPEPSETKECVRVQSPTQV